MTALAEFGTTITPVLIRCDRLLAWIAGPAIFGEFPIAMFSLHSSLCCEILEGETSCGYSKSAVILWNKCWHHSDCDQGSRLRRLCQLCEFNVSVGCTAFKRVLHDYFMLLGARLSYSVSPIGLSSNAWALQTYILLAIYGIHELTPFCDVIYMMVENNAACNSEPI